VESGRREGYFWLTTDEYALDDLLRACPHIVVGKHLAVTSFDSGSLSLSEEEIAGGWQSRAGVAYSPKVESIEKLPHDVYDEWYVFQAPKDLGALFCGNIFETSMQAGQVAAFVNFGGFSLHSPEMQDLANLFWKQLEFIQPESFIADGTLLNFVTRDPALFSAVSASLR
jgi:hypothetical protein